jgi:6-phosphogluconolactonase
MNPKPSRRNALKGLSLAVVLATLGASTLASTDTVRHGKVFTSTNAPSGNELLIFATSDDGPATLRARLATQGAGTGAGLGSQGAVTLSSSGRFLFVVNAASNTVSTFALDGPQARLVSVVDSGGLMPTSVAEYNGLVVVLNANGSGNVAGFRNQDGQLVALADGVRGLSAAGGTAPAQVGFSPDGDVLVVSERNTNVLTSFGVRRDGSLGARVVTPSAGATPFGFAFARPGVLVVSEAAGGATDASTVSSYRFDERGAATPALISPAVPTTQTAACWIAITPTGRFAYAANAGSSSVSSFSIARNGSIGLLQGQAGLTGPNGGATDMAVSRDGQQLHVLAPRGLQIVSFAVAHDGSLSALGAAGGLPAGTVGLAAN